MQYSNHYYYFYKKERQSPKENYRGITHGVETPKSSAIKAYSKVGGGVTKIYWEELISHPILLAIISAKVYHYRFESGTELKFSEQYNYR